MSNVDAHPLPQPASEASRDAAVEEFLAFDFSVLDQTLWCIECDQPINGEPVHDEGDIEHLPPLQWRTWCDDDCHVTSAEKDGMS